MWKKSFYAHVAKFCKTFFFIIDKETKQPRVFVVAKPFQPSLIFASEARACPSGAPFRLLALTANIRSSWKGSRKGANRASIVKKKVLLH